MSSSTPGPNPTSKATQNQSLQSLHSSSLHALSLHQMAQSQDGTQSRSQGSPPQNPQNQSLQSQNGTQSQNDDPRSQNPQNQSPQSQIQSPQRKSQGTQTQSPQTQTQSPLTQTQSQGTQTQSHSQGTQTQSQSQGTQTQSQSQGTQTQSQSQGTQTQSQGPQTQSPQTLSQGPQTLSQGPQTLSQGPQTLSQGPQTQNQQNQSPQTQGQSSIVGRENQSGHINDDECIPNLNETLNEIQKAEESSNTTSDNNSPLLALPINVPYVIENLPPHLRAGIVDVLSQKPSSTLVPPVGRDLTVNFKPPRLFRNKPRKDPEPEPPIEGGTPLPFLYSSKDWLGKTPKSYVMEYFQRSNLQPPKWIRESHSSRQMHLIKVTFQDQTGKETTLYADRYFRSIKDAEHNTSILVLAHLIPGAKEPKDIIERMSQLQAISKLQKKRKYEQKSLRMAAFSYKNKVYGRTAPPPNLYPPNPTTSYDKNSQTQKQYENYGYGYDGTQYYDPSTYGQGGYTQGTYDYYNQQSYANYDYYNQQKQDSQQTTIDYSNLQSSAAYNPYANTIPTNQRTDNRAYQQQLQTQQQMANRTTGYSPYPAASGSVTYSAPTTAAPAAWTGYNNIPQTTAGQVARGYTYQGYGNNYAQDATGRGYTGLYA